MSTAMTIANTSRGRYDRSPSINNLLPSTLSSELVGSLTNLPDDFVTS